MTSRIIVKNLPKSVTEEKLLDLFGKKGTVTDVQLKYTLDGRFRHFAFIGYSSEVEAESARVYFDKTFIGATKIDVQSCANLGDPSKPRAWSKYSVDSSRGKATKRRVTDIQVTNASVEPKKPRKKKKEEEILKKCRENPEFLEFLEIHRKKSSWGNDTVLDDLQKQVIEKSESQQNDCSAETLDPITSAEAGPPKLRNNTQSSSETETQPKKKRRRNTKDPRKDLFTVKLRGLPEKARKKEIKEFFAPLLPKSIRIPPTFRGLAYVSFQTNEDLISSLHKDKSFVLGNQISVRKVNTAKENRESSGAEKLSHWAAQSAELEKECESVGESGRIFLRNLSYLSTEDQIKELFEKFGPVTEVHLPLDRHTRKIKGFGFVSFLLPEHGTKALNELDGTIFLGRMLHLLPSKNKTDHAVDETENPGRAFKVAKALKQKQSAGSSHNWNTLFMGQNAIAQVVSQKYGVSKEELLLDKEEEIDRKQTSVGVRMALAEADIVDEARRFLKDNDVCLEAFDNAKAERSKTVILAKNLPAKTVAKDLVELFSKYGEIGRVVLPPSGITAIVEFIEPAEARVAFKKLAYTKFGGMPLYLEWAPLETFKSSTSVAEPSESKGTKMLETQDTKSPALPSIDEEELFDMIPEPDTTLFVKNLNFDTVEETIRNHFKKCGPVYSVTVARKKNSKQPGLLLSMGYGFVQYYLSRDAQKALKELQRSMLENHVLELKKSNRTLQSAQSVEKIQVLPDESEVGPAMLCSKLIVRNVPFQATQTEVKQLFSPFGEIRACRLPLKGDGSGEHRGFAFVDFSSQIMAKKAFETLGKSTHLYGRRLVLEWAKKEVTVEALRRKTAKQFEFQKAGGAEAGRISTKKAITRYFHSQDLLKTERNGDGEDND